MRKVKIGDITNSCLGKMLDAEKNKGEYQPYLANINVRWGDFDLSNLSLMRFEESEEERYGIDNGDLIMCEGGEPGRCAIWRGQIPGMKIQKALHRIRVKEDVIVEYLYYWFLLAGKNDLLKRYFTETTIKHLPGEVLKDIEIVIPSLDIQKSISNVLSSIDSKILLNNKINDNLQQQLKLLYDYWFTQFDFPDEKGKPYRSAGGKMVWNEKIKRKIPYGWIVENVALNSISTIIKPGVDIFKTKTYLATADVNRNIISDGSVVDYETRESRANMQPTKNSVWFAKMKNSVKHIYFNEEMSSLIKSTILSTGFCGLQCCNNSFEYMSSFIEHSYFETIKDTLAHGATQEAVNNDDLSAIFLIVPSAEILNLYHERTHGIYAQISKNICENRRLVHMRDFLLPMLMNGQATIED